MLGKFSEDSSYRKLRMLLLKVDEYDKVCNIRKLEVSSGRKYLEPMEELKSDKFLRNNNGNTSRRNCYNYSVSCSYTI